MPTQSGPLGTADTLAAVRRRPAVSALLRSSERRTELAIRAARKAQTVLWPESRVALRMPVAFNPPPPSKFASFGEGSWLVPPTRISGAEHIAIGSRVALLEHVEIRAEPEIATTANSTKPLVTIGDRTMLARFATIWATVGVHIGAEVLSSDYITIIDCWRQPDDPTTPFTNPRTDVPAPPSAPVIIEDGAYLGCGCIITPGVTVGAGAFVGEGSVVMSDVPPHSVVYGNPAKVTSQWSAADGWQGEMFGLTA